MLFWLEPQNPGSKAFWTSVLTSADPKEDNIDEVLIEKSLVKVKWDLRCNVMSGVCKSMWYAFTM